jgi:hypothetical protein
VRWEAVREARGWCGKRVGGGGSVVANKVAEAVTQAAARTLATASATAVLGHRRPDRARAYRRCRLPKVVSTLAA